MIEVPMKGPTVSESAHLFLYMDVAISEMMKAHPAAALFLSKREVERAVHCLRESNSVEDAGQLAMALSRLSQVYFCLNQREHGSAAHIVSRKLESAIDSKTDPAQGVTFFECGAVVQRLLK